MGTAGASERATELVRQWDARLDEMDYFQILRVGKPTKLGEWPKDGELREAFATFASSFHPDRYRDCDAVVREQVERIFRRGNEALRVLLAPGLRQRYLRHLEQGKVRMEGQERTRGPTVAGVPVLRRDAKGASATGAADAVASGSMPSSTAASDGARAGASASSAVSAVSIESLVSHPTALVFAKEADALLARGEVKKALFQLQIVLSKEPDNAALQARIADLTPPKKP